MPIEFNTKAPQTQMQTTTPADLIAKMTGDSTKAKEVVSKALEVLAGANLSVTKSDNAGADGVAEKKTSGATNVPSLDNPGDPKQVEANLEKLISYLQLENEDLQTDQAKDRIELQQGSLDREHDGRMEEIDKSIKKMKDAEKSAKVNRFFGWLGAVLSVVAAVALTVVTGGVAAGFAIAGAVLAVSSLVLNETGAMDKLTEKLAKHLQETYGMSKSDAQLAASLIINLTILAASLACSIGGMVAGFSSAASAAAKAADTAAKVTNTVSQTAKNIQNTVTIANTAVGAGALLSGGLNTYFMKRSEDAKADVTELEKFITALQQRLDESEEELQKILEMIQANIGQVADMLSSATDTSSEIARNIGAMA